MTLGAACMLGGLLMGGCGKGERRIVRIDALATDHERLMLARYLPPGTPEEDARQALPRLGAVDAHTHTARQTVTLMGRQAELDVMFAGGCISSCGYVLQCSDSGAVCMLYDSLQREYTAELGNYHEDFGDAVRPACSQWASDTYILVLTRARAANGFRLAWHFKPRTDIAQQEEPS